MTNRRRMTCTDLISISDLPEIRRVITLWHARTNHSEKDAILDNVLADIENAETAHDLGDDITEKNCRKNITGALVHIAVSE